MPPVGFLVAALATIGITGLAAAIISGVAAIAIDIGISLLVGSIAQALTPTPGLKSTLTVSLNANDPRRVIVGRAGTAGALVTFQSWGDNNNEIVLIFRVADHKCQGFAPQINITGTLTNGSATITSVSSTAGIRVGDPIVSHGSGVRFPPGTFVAAIPSSSTIVMSNEATFSISGANIVVNCGLYWSGNPVQLGVGGAVPQFFADGQDNCWVTFSTGDWNQSADADMVANSGGRWDANSRGRGVAYFKVKANANVKAFPQGVSALFQFVAVIDGYAAYDRRQDSSVGGSGSQRFNDQSTWTLSDNSIVVAENMLRGIRVEDTTGTIGSRAMDTIFGLDLTDADLPFAEGVAAMNACDTAVALLAGGTEPMYRCDGVIAPNSGDTFDSHLADVLATAGATLVQSPGRIFMLPAVAQTPVRSFVDTDFRIDGPSKLVNDIPLDTIANAVVGQFADPASMYTGQPLPPRISLADAATDKGLKVTTLDLSYVTSQTRGQRLQEILRRRQRLQHTAQKALAPENLDLEAGDWISWQSDRWGWTKNFEIVQADGKGTANLDEIGMIVVDLAETAATVFTWTPSTDELSRFRPALLPSADPTAVAVTDLTAAAVSILSGTESKPAIAVTRDAVNDPTVVAIEYQYNAHGLPAGAPQVLTATLPINPATESGTQGATLTAGVVGGFQYDVTAAYVRQPARDLLFCTAVTTLTATPATAAAPPTSGTVLFSAVGPSSGNGTTASWSYTLDATAPATFKVEISGGAGGYSDNDPGPTFTGGLGGDSTSSTLTGTPGTTVISGVVGCRGIAGFLHNGDSGGGTTAVCAALSLSMSAGPGLGATTSANGSNGTASGGSINTTGGGLITPGRVTITAV